MFEKFISLVKKLYPNREIIALHEPVFLGNEKPYLNECIDSTFVSYVGNYVRKFEELTANYTGSNYAIAMVNGTAALQIALIASGVLPDDEVITQPLTFVATVNAISHCGAKPVFIDVDLNTLGLSPEKLENWLKENTIIKFVNNKSICINKSTGKKISVILPVHIFGLPCKINEVVKIADQYNIKVIEDSAESIGSFYNTKHTGTFGQAGIFSYNGNKTITTGGGGMIVTNDEEIAIKARHLSTTGKVPHRYEFIHDCIAFNFRMTNVNAAIGVAQMECLETILANKRVTAEIYNDFFHENGVKFITEPENAKSNYWLNAIILNHREERDDFLIKCIENGINCRPIWTLMNELIMYKSCQTGNLDNANWLVNRVVNLPSGYRI